MLRCMLGSVKGSGQLIGKQESTPGRKAKTEKVKEHLQCQSKAQGTELVKHISKTESGKLSSQSESVCDRPENEQDNTDSQATTKVINLIIQQLKSTNFVVKVRCKYCDKPFNSITNHGKQLIVCAEAANDCKICGKIMYHKKSQLYDMSQDVWSPDSLGAHVKLHYPCQKKFTCPKCSAVSLIEKDLKVHVWQEHIQSIE